MPSRLPALTLLLILAWTSFTGQKAVADEWQVPADKSNFHVFVLMGQSNMAGYGKLLPEDSEPVPGVVNIPNKVRELAWQPAAHPLHNLQPSNRFGLGLPFAKHYRERHPEVTVGLISCAVGGAGIDRLKKGTGTYAAALRRIHWAQQQGVLKGMLWHQGESDTVRDALADSYADKLHQLIADLRADVGDPRLPVVVGNLAEFYGTGKGHSAPDRVARINTVRQALRAIPETLPRTAFAESTGGSSPDHHMVHFDRKSCLLLGKRYFDAYLGTLSPQDSKAKHDSSQAP